MNACAEIRIGDFLPIKPERKAGGQYRTALQTDALDEQCRAAYERLQLQLKK